MIVDSQDARQLSRRARADAVLVTAALAGNNVANYLLTVVAARLLAPGVFGEFGSLLALMVIGVVPAMGLQTVVALRVAERRVDAATEPLSRTETDPIMTLGLLTSGAVTLAGLALSPVITSMLHLDSPWQAIWLALSLAPLSMLGVFHGVLQGTHRFRALAVMIGMEAFGKAGGALAGLALFGHTAGALAMATICSSIVAVTGWLVCGAPALAVKVDSRQVRAVAHAASGMLALVLLVNLDLVLARHYLPAAQAGEYAVGAVLTKAAYWLPSAVGILVLPRLADPRRRRRLVPIALAVCVGVDAVAVVGAAVFGQEVMMLIGGPQYAGSHLPMWAFALVGSVLSVMQILLFSRIASADTRSVWLVWTAVVVEVALVTTAFHGGVAAVVTAAAVATGLVAGAGAAIEVFAHRRRPSAG
ncbi:MAG TPA: polysaccharide biosynthesis protein [Actinokineospora sp.]|nr:polysaccharide biosynthesis protein [Actinokineospora sp.]